MALDGEVGARVVKGRGNSLKQMSMRMTSVEFGTNQEDEGKDVGNHSEVVDALVARYRVTVVGFKGLL